MKFFTAFLAFAAASPGDHGSPETWSTVAALNAFLEEEEHHGCEVLEMDPITSANYGTTIEVDAGKETDIVIMLKGLTSGETITWMIKDVHDDIKGEELELLGSSVSIADTNNAGTYLAYVVPEVTEDAKKGDVHYFMVSDSGTCTQSGFASCTANQYATYKITVTGGMGFMMVLLIILLITGAAAAAYFLM